MVRLVTPEIFWSRVDFRGPDDCALYIGPGQVTKSGHIRISVEGKKTYASRYALRLVNGFWPDCALHRCDAPSCVNPNHLYDSTRTTSTILTTCRTSETEKLGIDERRTFPSGRITGPAACRSRTSTN
jgi:hypothetical protein